VTVKLLTPTGKRSIKIEAKIDTGFSGDVLLSFDKYTELGLQLYERGREALGRVANGYAIKLRVLLECEVYTSLLSSVNLLGRGVLNKARTLLDFSENLVGLCFK